ncbi:MAG: protein kinase, partial [Polyangiales bacterium]
MLRDSHDASSARYELIGSLGSGGFGAVYEARDARTGQRVAIKELEHTSGEGISRFKHEFRALADCHHPNLVGLRELIEQGGRWKIVMELVPGTDFLSYVTAGDAPHRFDEARLRGALLGVVTGLRALHGYGILHRDLKPSNVRVTPEGRAVLLDFGLVTSIQPEHQSTDALGLGTVAYMAPEQAQGRQLGPEADVYALGVCLFEALTGKLPFEGATPIETLMRKQQGEAPRASSLAPETPDDLDALCSQLLALDPQARPDLRAVHVALTGADPGPIETLAPAARNLEALFSGREAELQNLARALAQTEEGALRVVLVEGESGVGKSELVTEFVRTAQRDHPTMLVLRGRCYENEQVAYKAFDGCIDELAKVLARLSAKDCDALLPLRSALLGQLFPVLRNVRSIARAPREGFSAEPTARRLEAFAALAALLARLAAEHPLVLVVDDLQWADAESFRLLQALFEAPEVPPLLVLATVRPRDELELDVLAHVQALRQRPETSLIEVLGLPPAQARALARKLLAREVDDGWLATLASESEGHPLFLSELVRYAEAHPAAAHGPIKLEDALRARIEHLDPGARALLELVALAARPHGAHVFARALSVGVDDAARTLLSERFLRMRKGAQLGCFHDRIRHAVVELTPRARLASLHRRLAEALAETDDSDASEQARHWDLAGEPERASDAYERAADLALEALAFTRAARLYGRALELREGPADDRRRRLVVQRAHALAGAGQSAEAAALYQEAADRVDGDARIDLRNRAAQHLVLSSQVVPGVAAARALLREMGFVLPRRTLFALLRFLWDAMWVALPRRKRAPPSALGPADPRMRVVYDLSYVTAIVDTRTYLPLNMQAVRRALRGNTRIDAARAASWRGWMRALQGSLAQAVPLLDQARALIEQDAAPAGLAAQWFVEGSAFMAGYDFAESSRRLAQAHRLLEEECPDQVWMLLTVRYHLGSTWYHLGQHALLAANVTRWLASARERNDVMSVALITGMGYGFLRHLLVDAPQRAVRELDDVLAQIPADPYAFPHLGRFVAMTYVLLYEGGGRALAFVEAHEREHGGAFLMRTGSVKNGRRMLRCLAMLSAAAVASEPARASLLADARALTRKLGRRSAFEQGFVELACAQIEALIGDRARARTHARAARALYERGQHGNQRSARYVEGLLEGGERGRAACEAVIAELRAEGWRDPLRALSMAAPLHAHLARDDMPAVLAPRTLVRGRYEVLGTLDPRGIGSVFRARDVHTGRDVALKELTHRGSASLARFKQEFRALQEVQSANLVQLESMFSHEGTWYIAMELIEGQDLLRYVRPAGALDAARLRLSFEGLLEGLIALHDAGFVHRDVRPEKVRVTAEGRVVLLDFGLIARIGDAREVVPVGAPEHAAPEQLTGHVPHPSADVYALGDCLYRALTGRAPHEAASAVELVRKKAAPPASPECPELPALAAHCQVMLSPIASARPSLNALRSALRADDARANIALSALRTPEPVQKVVFTGRAAELSMLDDLFERTTDDGLMLVLVEAASGMGKSALASAFAERVLARHPNGHVLRSRCYESEQLAHRAFDGAVDQLAQLLRGLPTPHVEALMPKRAALLGQLFPVLASVPAVGQASKKGLPADPASRQLGARTCFASLLSNLTRDLELLLVVDDLQWADDDSFRLLDALLAEARALPLTIV